MKISLIITAAIVALFAFFGWQVRQHLDASRERRDRMVTEARERGFEKMTGGMLAVLSSKTELARADDQIAREMKAREIARKLAIFGNDKDAIGAMGPDGDQDKQLDFQEGLAQAAELDSAGLKLLINQIIANSELTEEMRGNFIMMVGYYLTEKEPLRAINLYMDAMSRLAIPADHTRNMIGFALEKLAGSNPQQALEWTRRNAKTHPELVDDGVRSGMVSGMARSDASLAFSALGEFGMSKDSKALEGIGGSATSGEERSSVLAAMRDYCASHAGSEEERQIAMKSTLAGMAARFSQGGFNNASKWLETAKLNPDEAAGLAGGLDASLAKGDTGKWIDWMAGNVSVDQLTSKVDELVKFWTQEDYRATGTWLDSAAEGPARETAVKAYAGAVASADPGVAAQWAQTLPAGPERVELMKNIYAEWMKKDETAAGRFARDNGIGE